MIIKKAAIDRIDEMMDIYAYAREQMKQNGNPTQWGDTKPTRTKIENDIKNGNSYLMEENGSICGVFSFIIGEDDTYHYIKGKWLNDEEYGTIHSVASNGIVKGIMKYCLQYCEARAANVRIDTHENNKILQHILEKYGYQKCGIIYVHDGSERIAYQKCCNASSK